MNNWAIKDSYGFTAVEVASETKSFISYRNGRLSGRSAKTRFVAWRGSETTARKLAERLNSARAERNRRLRAATDWFDSERDRLIAQGIEAEGQDGKAGLVHESPTPEQGDAP